MIKEFLCLLPLPHCVRHVKQAQEQIAAPQAAVQLRPQPGQVLPPALLQPREQPQMLEPRHLLKR